MDPWSGRAHAVAVLQDAALLKTHAEQVAERDRVDLVDGQRAALGPQMMADLAGRLLAAALGGTLLPPGSLVKSPWGRTDNLIGTRKRIGPTPVFADHWQRIQESGAMWTTLPGAGPLKLRDVVAALADRWWHETAGASARFSKSRFRKKRGDPSWLSRNTFVFDLARWWAYDRYERDGAAIREAADAFNAELTSPLGVADVSSIARSIGRFMNGRYQPGHGDPRIRRDAEAGIGLDAHGKRQLSGKRSAEANAADTDSRISTATASLQALGAAVTNVAIAGLAGISERTVRRRRLPLAGRTNGSLSGSDPAGGAEEPEATTFSETDSNPESLPFSESVIHATTPADDGKRQVGAIIESLKAVIAVNTESGDDIDGTHLLDGIYRRRQRPISGDVHRRNPSTRWNPPTTTATDHRKRTSMESTLTTESSDDDNGRPSETYVDRIQLPDEILLR